MNQSEVNDALAVSNQLSQHLQELRQHHHLLRRHRPSTSHHCDGDTFNIEINEDNGNSTKRDESRVLLSSLEVEGYASPSQSQLLLNSVIQSVDCLEEYLESITHYSWEEEEKENEVDDVALTSPPAAAEVVLRGIVILREYIARISLLRHEYYVPTHTPSLSCHKDEVHDDAGDSNCKDEEKIIRDNINIIGDKFLDWAIAAKHAGMMEDCVQAHMCRMGVEPIWKELDAVRLLGMKVDDSSNDREGSRVAAGCQTIIEIEEIPTRGIFEIARPPQYQQLSTADNDTTPSPLSTQKKPSKNAIQLGTKIYDIFHNAGFNYWNCRRMLIDVLLLSSNDHDDDDEEEMSSLRWDRIYSANCFFEHRHDAVHHFALRVGDNDDDEPWRALAYLFLFGISLERTILYSAIGEEHTHVLVDAGLLRNNPADATYLVGEVQIYPLDTGMFEWRTEEEASTSSRTGAGVYCMTDWSMESLRSPRNAIMTIGYDTLELLALSSGKDVFAQPSTSDGGERVKSRVLDLCCGCGIQGIFAAKQSSSWNNPRVQTELVAMDINERAVRFAMGNACLNGLFASDTPSVYSAIEADLYEPVRGSTSSRQIGRFDCILCNPPFVAVPIANDMTGIAPALYAVGGGRDGMNVLRRILEKCFDILDDGEHRQLLMVTELPNIETSCALLSSMLPTAARVNVAYIEDDVETAYDYAKEREVEAGFDIANRDWRPPANNITNRALALISISRSISSEKNLFCYRNELNRDADEEDQFLTRDGIHFVRENLL
jgi:methylase of polypeptide subunit release factors